MLQIMFLMLQIIIKYVFFQMDEHEKALNILVGKLGDTKEAERYCTVNSRVSQCTCTVHLQIFTLYALTHIAGSKYALFYVGKEQGSQAEIVSVFISCISPTK